MTRYEVTGQPQFMKINQTMEAFMEQIMEQENLCILAYDSKNYQIGFHIPAFEFSNKYEISYNYNRLLGVQLSGYEYTGSTM